MSGAMKKKVNMISQIVRLRQVVKRWKSRSLCTTPPGSVAVYVGPERCRFVVPTRFLNLPVFLALLDQAEEEFGYQASGGIVLPCEAGFFACVVDLLDRDERSFHGFGLHEFVQLVCEARDRHYSCSTPSPPPAFCPATPLLQKARA